MGLFDDLIKKTTGTPSPGSGSSQDPQGQTGGNPPQDPLQNVIITEQSTFVGSAGSGASAVNAVTPTTNEIQITEEHSILTEKPVVLVPELPDTPKPIEETAEDASFLIVGGEGTETSSQTITIDSRATENISSVPSVVIPTQNVENIAENQQQSLRDMQLSRLKNDTTSPTITSEDSELLNNLFGENTEETGNGEEVTETIAPQVTPSIAAVIEEKQPESSEVNELFADPHSFIAASLEKIVIMIGHIESTHKAKLDEAAGYKAEKEKYATLESTAYEDAEKMMREKAHAEKMKAYFIDQQKHTYDNSESDEVAKSKHKSSVETTLTSLSVKNSVDEATSEVKKTTRKQKIESVVDV